MGANERALAAFFKRNLPPGWKFSLNTGLLVLRRIAPVYILKISAVELQTMGNSRLLAHAHKNGRKTECQIELKVERHDDPALVRQKVRLFKEVRADIERARQKPAEFEKTRKILTEKLEIAPLYRVGTLYLYPRKNQCIMPRLDWYVGNTLIADEERVMPFEAAEEIEIIYRNLDQLKFWNQ